MNETERRDAVVEAAPKAVQPLLRLAVAGPSPSATDAAADALRAVAFPLRKGGGIALPSQLDPAQTAVARALAFARGVDVQSHALPMQARTRLRWIGLELPRVLEDEVGPADAREPRWSFYARLAARGESARMTEDLEGEPLRRIEALVELSLGAYELRGFSVMHGSLLGALVEAHLPELVDYARTLGPALVAAFGDRTGEGRRLGDGGPRPINDFHWVDDWASMIAYLPLVVTKQPFDASVVPLVFLDTRPVNRNVDVVAWFPDAERDALATAVCRRSNAYSVPPACAILERFALPGVAAWMVEGYGGGKPDGQTPPALRAAWKKQLEELAAARPDLAPLFASALSPKARAALKITAPKPPKKPAKWAPCAPGASAEERVLNFEDALARTLTYAPHTFVKALDELLLDVFGRAWRPLPIRRPASLNDLERRVLTVYTNAGAGVNPQLSHAGLPAMRDRTRRMLGLDAPAPDDALVEVDGERLPAWCAIADAVYSGASFDAAARAIAKLPDAATIWSDLESGWGFVTWMPIAARPNVTGVSPLPSHAASLLRFLGVLGAETGAPIVDGAKRRITAALEAERQTWGLVLVHLLVLARAGELAAIPQAAFALAEKDCPADRLEVLRDALRARTTS